MSQIKPLNIYQVLENGQQLPITQFSQIPQTLSARYNILFYAGSSFTDLLTGQEIEGGNTYLWLSGLNQFINISQSSGPEGNVYSVNGLTGVVLLYTDNIPEGSINLYFEESRVLATPLSGYINGYNSPPLENADTVLESFEKLQSQIDNLVPMASTGAVTGMALSVGTDPSKFTVSDGYGLKMVSGRPIRISTNFGSAEFTPQFLGVAPQTFVYVTSDDTLLQTVTPPTAQTRREDIFLGYVAHPNGVTIDFVGNSQTIAANSLSLSYDMFRALGMFNVSGNVIGPNGNNLFINKSEGELASAGSNYAVDEENPCVQTLSALTQATFAYAYRAADGSMQLVLPPTNTVDPNNYDDGSGTLAAIPTTPNRWQIQTVYLYPQNTLLIAYGQVLYTSLNNAIAGIGDAVDRNWPELAGALLRGYICMRNNQTNLSGANVEFKEANRFGDEGQVSGSSGSTTLSGSYNASGAAPQIVTTLVNGALGVQVGVEVGQSNTDAIYAGYNGAGSLTYRVNGDGTVSATSINKLTLTAPATSATLTIADGKTLTSNNTLTFTGTDSSNVAFGTGGTVVYTSNNLSVFAATTSAQLAGVISDETGSGALVFANSPNLVSPYIGAATGASLDNPSNAFWLGATTTQILVGQASTDVEVKSKVITVNQGGATSSGTACGIQVEENGVAATGYVRTSGSGNGWLLKAPARSGFYGFNTPTSAVTCTFDGSAVTSTRTVTVPDANSNFVRPSTAGTNQFATGIASTGIISYAQPSTDNLSTVTTAPAAGKMGEEIRSTVLEADAINLTDNVWQDLTSISLTAGIWDVSLLGIMMNAGGGIYETVEIATTTTSGNSTTGLVRGLNGATFFDGTGMSSTPSILSLSIPSYRVVLTSTTTYYFKVFVDFAALGGFEGYGTIRAVRVA